MGKNKVAAAQRKSALDKNAIAGDLAFLRGRVLGILLFGSQVDKPTPRSDIDICIVAKGRKDVELVKEVFRNVDVVKKKYDVHAFGDLPLHIQAGIIEKNEGIFVPDWPELGEYFYYFRKLWNDQKHRNEVSKEEILAMM
ncbi:nucleotidyltransferase domain-containing protein [Candidatus Woesearchaeota archaeon]|nr:nucleotidyltransferase domain-containing protein [Candidatus Woesearchaeota archaeon]